eukprot:748186-Hanusia_phi.AAC.2
MSIFQREKLQGKKSGIPRSKEGGFFRVPSPPLPPHLTPLSRLGPCHVVMAVGAGFKGVGVSCNSEGKGGVGGGGKDDEATRGEEVEMGLAGKGEKAMTSQGWGTLGEIGG